jgi:hypothetical protein
MEENIEIRNKALKATQASYSNKTPDGFRKNKNLSDRRSKVYEIGDDVFISYRGTQPTNKSDVFIADLAIATNTQWLSPRFRESADKFERVKTNYGNDKNIYLTGHSLGSSSAAWVARNYEGAAGVYGFNGGSNPYYDSKETFKDAIGLSQKRNSTQIHNYITGSDPISIGNLLPRKNTTTTYVPRISGYDPHTLKNFTQNPDFM